MRFKILALLFGLAMAALAPASASAETLCRCAYASLEQTMCRNDLTAAVFVYGGYTDRATGNNVYLGVVRKTYRGTPVNTRIKIEAPASCGFELSAFQTYLVSLNATKGADYTTFACSSFVKPYRELTRTERTVLLDPACAPTCDDVTCGAGEHCELQQVQCIRAPCPAVPACVPDEEEACYDYTGMDFGLCKMLMGYAVKDGSCQPISGCGSTLPFYPDRESCMGACGVPADGVCYRFSESDPDAFVNLPCADDLKCTATSTRIGFDVVRSCKPLDYCIDNSTAAADCDAIPHIAVPGAWTCVSNRCVYRPRY